MDCAIPLLSTTPRCYNPICFSLAISPSQAICSQSKKVQCGPGSLSWYPKNLPFSPLNASSFPPFSLELISIEVGLVCLEF